MRQVTVLDHTDAQVAIAAVANALNGSGKAAVVAVVDPHGELLGFLRVAGAGLPSINIALNKAYTAARNQGATSGLGRAVRDPEQGFDIGYFGDARFVGWEGGLPVRIEGHVVGAVGVSGLTGEEDAALAQLGIDAILARLSK